MLSDDSLERPVDAFHFVGIPCGVGVHRCISSGQQKGVALAQRNLQCLRDTHQGWPAWNTAAALDEADLLLRNPGVNGDIELTSASDPAPLFEQNAQLTFVGQLVHRDPRLTWGSIF